MLDPQSVIREGLQIAAFCLLLPYITASSAEVQAAGPVVIAQAKPGLPTGGSAMGQYRRGADGRIEVVDPTQKTGSAGRGPCSPQALCVGPGRAYETLAAAAAAARVGDVIEIVAGTYRESVAL